MKPLLLLLLLLTLFSCNKDKEAANKKLLMSHKWDLDSLTQTTNGQTVTTYVTPLTYQHLEYDDELYYTEEINNNILVRNWEFDAPDKIYWWFDGSAKSEDWRDRIINITNHNLILEQKNWDNGGLVHSYFHAE